VCLLKISLYFRLNYFGGQEPPKIGHMPSKISYFQWYIAYFWWLLDAENDLVSCSELRVCLVPLVQGLKFSYETKV
jgi:hypothetical protein